MAGPETDGVLFCNTVGLNHLTRRCSLASCPFRCCEVSSCVTQVEHKLTVMATCEPLLRSVCYQWVTRMPTLVLTQKVKSTACVKPICVCLAVTRWPLQHKMTRRCCSGVRRLTSRAAPKLIKKNLLSQQNLHEKWAKIRLFFCRKHLDFRKKKSSGILGPELCFLIF